MHFGKFARAFAPVAAIALAAALSGCDGDISINGQEGKKLAELDLAGKAPTKLTILGADEVRVIEGAALAIRVEGDSEAAEHLRFTLDDDTLGIMRERSGWNLGSSKAAIILVTMPAPREVTVAGSGKVTLATLARDAELTIAGSGSAQTTAISGESLKLTIAGSGSYQAAGTVRRLNLIVAGSGSAAMDALRVDRADVSMAGSGDASFASDGQVDASIMGSGEIRVIGRARCTVSSMGSGRLVCENGTVDAERAPDTPATPPTPETPETPEAPKT